MLTSNDTPKYRKKKDNGSKTKKRSNHKHVYEKVIMEHPFYSFGFAWTKRCSICGRTQSVSSSARLEGLLRPRDHKYIKIKDFYTVEELKERFPGVRIFKRNRPDDGSISFDDNDVEEM